MKQTVQRGQGRCHWREALVIKSEEHAGHPVEVALGGSILRHKSQEWIVLSMWGTASGHAQGEKLPSNQSCWLLSLSTALDFLCQKRILSEVALSDLYCRGSLCVSSGEKTEEDPRQRLQPSSPWDKSGGKCWPLVRGELGSLWSLDLLTDPVSRLRAVNHNCSSRGFSWRHFPQMGKGFIIWWASLYIECWQAEIQVPLGCRCWASMSAPPLPPAEKTRYLEEDCPSAHLFEAWTWVFQMVPDVPWEKVWTEDTTRGDIPKPSQFPEPLKSRWLLNGIPGNHLIIG